jgi:hypothetical protein
VSRDEKLDVRLNTLEAALLAMGDELQTMKFRQDLQVMQASSISVSLLSLQ